MDKFFIIGLGRSGTKFLSKLLNQDEHALVRHEPYNLDKQLLFYRYAGGFDTVLNQMLTERFEQMLPDPSMFDIYGEVNSYLRYEADWLRQRFDPVLLGIARDGRDFVRSAYIRPVLTYADHQQPIIPMDDNSYAMDWNRYSRFQKLCWYWNITNRYLMEKLGTVVRFERLIKDYDYFTREITKKVGITISRNTWKYSINNPENTSDFSLIGSLVTKIKSKIIRKDIPHFTPLPHWPDWNDRLKADFYEICGETMKQIGYLD